MTRLPPAISVIVPVYRDWPLVPDLLAALTAQTGAPTFELILIDNGDPALRPALDLPPFARILEEPRPGSYAARNAGIAEAAGPLLVFTDADCRPEPQWLAALHADWQRQGDGLLAGPVRVIPATPRPNLWEIYDTVRGIPQARYVSRGYAAGANLAAPAALVRQLGGFDATRLSGGDAEFCRRAGAAGHPVRLVVAAVVRHPARASWAAIATKARRIKGGQLTRGPLPRRAAWVGLTLLPPLRDLLPLLRAPDPLTWRLRAVAVRLMLWGVELAELVRLAAGGPAERR